MATKTAKTKSKYNQKELAEFKAIIDLKLDKARKEYEIFKGSISRNDDHGTDDTSPTFKVLEEGSEVLSKEENAQDFAEEWTVRSVVKKYSDFVAYPMNC